MEKSADRIIVTPRLIALDPLILVGMVESLHSSVTLLAENSVFALTPAQTLLQSLAVFRRIFKILGRSPEVSGVVCEITGF